MIVGPEDPCLDRLPVRRDEPQPIACAEPAYPGTYDTVCVCLTTIAAGGPTLDFNIEVHDDDGAAGAPGTLLGSVPVSVNTIPVFPATAFFDIDIASLGLNIPSGNVWIGVQRNPMNFPSRFVCADESPGTPLRPGFLNFNNLYMWEATQTSFPDCAVPGIFGSDADLSITKTGVDNEDGTADFTLTVNNAGPDPATNVVVVDDLRACTSYISDDCGGMNVPPWTWNIGNLAVNAPVSCTITVDATGCTGTVSNTASVTADQTDPNPGGESSTFDLGIGNLLEIPTLGRWGILALIGLLIGLGVWKLRSA